MKIKQTVDMPVENFYNVLLQSAAYDIELHSGKKVNPAELNEFSYLKSYPNSSSATITITDQVTNDTYGFLTSTSKRKYHTKYNLVALEDEKSCSVIYTEELISKGKLQRLNDQIMSRLLQKSKKKRIRSLFKAIEEEYRQQYLPS